MKKLLAMLTTIMSLFSITPMVLANSPVKIKENKLETNKIRVRRELKKIINNKNIEILQGDNIYRSLNNNNILVDHNNNVYFTSNTNNNVWILKNGETSFKKYDKVIDVLGFVIDNRNNVYFSTKTSDFVLQNGETELVKITGVEEKIGAHNIVVDNDDNVYFGTLDGIYKLKYGDLKANKINETDFFINFSGIIVNKQDNLYFATKNIIYLLKKNEITPIKIFESVENDNEIDCLVIDNDNNLYFRKDNIAWILKNGKTTATKLFDQYTNNGFFIHKNNVCLLTVEGLYILNEDKSKFEKIEGINQNVWSLKIDYNNHIYLATNKHGIFKIKNKQNNINIINFNNLINTAIILYYQDKFNSDDNYLKELKDINADNLVYSNVTVTKNIEPTYTKTNENICSGKTILENDLPSRTKVKNIKL